MKEKAKAVPKQLVRRGLDDGTQRLHGQLREAAQQDQRDDYGGDAIERTADRGFRQMERMAEKLCSKQKQEKQNAGDIPETESTWTGRKPPSGKESATADRIKTRGHDRTDGAAPPSGGQHNKREMVQQKRLPAVKTKESCLKRQPEAVQTETPMPARSSR